MSYVTSGLQLYLNASDYTSGSATTWNDKSGNGNNGTLYGFTFDGTMNGWTTNGLATDGINGYVEGTLTSFTQRGKVDYTLELYTNINVANWMAYIGIFTATSPNGTGSAVLCSDNNNNMTLDTSAQDVYSSKPFNSNALTHYVVTFAASSSTYSFYKDNVLVASGNYPAYVSNFGASDALQYRISAWPGTPITTSSQTIKIARIYNIPLSSAQVTQNYNDATSGGGGGTNANVNSVSATATGQGYIPTVTTTKSPSVTSVSATATSAGYAPVVTAVQNPTVASVYANATVQGYPPTVTASTPNPIVYSVPAIATDQGYAPTILAVQNPTVTSAYATATSAGYAPTVSAVKSPSVVSTSATATAQGYIPTVTTTKSPIVASVYATASAIAKNPTVAVSGGSFIVSATAAIATVSAMPPTLNKPITAILTMTYNQNYNKDMAFDKLYTLNEGFNNAYSKDIVLEKTYTLNMPFNQSYSKDMQLNLTKTLGGVL